MSHIGQYAEIHYVSAHENEEMQRKRRDKGGEMSESWAAGCILQSAWDTSECEFVCSSVYVCLRVFGRKEAHSHPLNPMIQPSLHQAWAWERGKTAKEKELSFRESERGETWRRERSKQNRCNESESVSLSPSHYYVAMFLSAGVHVVLCGERLLGRGWGELGRFEVFLLPMASARSEYVLGVVLPLVNAFL